MSGSVRRPLGSLGAGVVVCMAIIGCGSAIGQGLSTAAQVPVASHAAAHSALSEGTHGLVAEVVSSGGRTRTYLIYVPPGDSIKHRLPLVIVYHGADDTAVNTVSETGLLTVAEQQKNMIVAFPQGYEDTWNDDAGDPPAEAAGVNDIAFTTTILRRTESNWYVDMSRVVATGFSNGAILAELLGCRLAANLTLIVPIEGQMAPTFSGNCRPSMPISVYEVHATDDQAIPYGGGTFSGVGGPVTVLSAAASAARWADLDKCGAKPSSSQAGGSILTVYKGCRDAVTVTLNSIQGGSHEWPPGFGAALSQLVSSLKVKRQAVKP